MEEIPSTLGGALLVIDADYFPNLHVLLKVTYITLYNVLISIRSINDNYVDVFNLSSIIDRLTIY